MKKLIFISIVMLFVVLTGINAQEAVVTTGGDASSTTGSVSYSMGQVVYSTSTGADGSVAQGVQQPYEISVVTALPETESIKLNFSVYPNPTTDFLTLRVTGYEGNNLSYHLFDSNGKLIMIKEVAGDEAKINMQLLNPSIYFLKVIDDNKEVKTFKVIKR